MDPAGSVKQKIDLVWPNKQIHIGSVAISIINPRRACARVTVLVLSVCVCVFSLFWHLAQSGVQTAVSATSARYGHEI